MDRPKISTKRKKSIKSGSMMKLKKEPREYDPMKDLLDDQLIAQAFWECLKDNDPEGAMEILEAHLHAKNKSKLARENDWPRTTIYHAFKSKNPSLPTVAKLVHPI